MTINCIALILYMCALVITGYLSDHFKAAVIIKRTVKAIIFLIIPTLALVDTKTLTSIIFAKLIFISLSAALIGPLHAWTQNISKVQNRYSQVSTAYSIGKMIAILILALTILIFECSHSLFLISLIFVITAISTHKILIKT